MLHSRYAAMLSICLGLWDTGVSPGQETRSTPEVKPAALSSHQDYGKAVAAAQKQKQMLLVYFRATQASPTREKFESEALAAPAIQEKLKGFTLLKVPTDVEVNLEGGRQTLLSHDAFSDMLCSPGLAIVDYAHPKACYCGCVVSAFPLTENYPYTAEQVAVILNLPPGTLTQRTMIYAVRTHPERPASTGGVFDPTLAAEAESHSEYQAKIHRQGHHFWERRFHSINACLPSGLTAKEVCAESWPGQGLLESAIECVRCWRQSSGHWQAVSSPHQLYGYDIKQGKNGIWYATGIFGG
jgi:hypothetical protein